MSGTAFAAVVGVSVLATACAQDGEPARPQSHLQIVNDGDVLSVTDEGAANPFPGVLPVRVRAKSASEAGRPVSYLITIGDRGNSSHSGSIGRFSCNVAVTNVGRNRTRDDLSEVDAGLPEGRSGRIVIDGDRYQVAIIVKGDGEEMNPTEVLPLLEEALPVVVDTLGALEATC
jgi:hypothetical protein